MSHAGVLHDPARSNLPKFAKTDTSQAGASKTKKRKKQQATTQDGSNDGGASSDAEDAKGKWGPAWHGNPAGKAISTMKTHSKHL
jgi:hypothetical protein